MTCIGNARTWLFKESTSDLFPTYLESIQVIELARGEEVEKVEQLLEVVLQRRSGQEKLEVDAVAGQGLEELGLGVFQPVGLVDAEDLPVDRAEAGGVDGDQLVGGQQDVELDR